jgi:hypothetical protein
MSFPMPKNKDITKSIYWDKVQQLTNPNWYPKTVKRKPKEVADQLPETLTERLKREDRQFERYWRQRGKWKSFEEFLNKELKKAA